MTKQRLISHLGCAVLAAALLLACAGCAVPTAQDEFRVQVTATTYPVYALACAVSAGVEGVSVSRLNTGQVSCLHDYTLTVSDMARLEQADLVLINCAGLEAFLDGVLDQLDAPLGDCSVGIDLLEADGQLHSHGEDGEIGHSHDHDPHYWMDPRNAAVMADTIAQALSQADPDNAGRYQANASLAAEALTNAYAAWTTSLSGLSYPYLITFHDGFRYFAHAFDLELLFAMEEEDGATASAKDILTASNLVKQYHLPAVFMEVNGSGSAARAVAGETGAAVSTLTMLMDGADAPKEAGAVDILTQLYLSPMEQNIKTLMEVLK